MLIKLWSAARIGMLRKVYVTRAGFVFNLEPRINRVLRRRRSNDDQQRPHFADALGVVDQRRAVLRAALARPNAEMLMLFCVGIHGLGAVAVSGVDERAGDVEHEPGFVLDLLPPPDLELLPHLRPLARIAVKDAVLDDARLLLQTPTPLRALDAVLLDIG